MKRYKALHLCEVLESLGEYHMKRASADSERSPGCITVGGNTRVTKTPSVTAFDNPLMNACSNLDGGN
jgi:hypothetical protein